MAVALVTDGLQVLLGPLGWAFADEALDVMALILTSWAIGFHPLLLPTFVVEFIPVIDLVPTWTGCTAAVIMLRRKAEPSSDIPIEATVVSEPPESNTGPEKREPVQLPPHLEHGSVPPKIETPRKA